MLRLQQKKLTFKRPVILKLLLGALLLVAVLALAACSGSGQPQTSGGSSGGTDPKAGEATQPKDNFPEREIVFIVPYGAGGGYDTLARTAAPILSANLPNNPAVVVKNVTGGGGLTGITSLYQSEPDGYTIGNMSGGAVMAQLVGKAQYDLNKFSWLGIMAVDKYITARSPKSKLTTLDQMRQAPQVLVGITGMTTIDGAAGIILGEQMGYKAKGIGHNGSQEAILGAMRGDLDIITYPPSALLESVKNGELVPMWVSSKNRMTDLPDAPTLDELGYPDLGTLLTLPRPLAAPPGLAENRAQILRKAFEAVLADPQYRELVEVKYQAEIDNSDAKQVLEMWDNQLKVLGPYKDLIAAEWK